MRFSFGAPRRNDPIKLDDPRPPTRYPAEQCCTGDAGKDGYSVLSRARPNAQGNPPPVRGVVGPAYQGPAYDFEQ